MPQYYPDLKSIQNTIEIMQRQSRDDKKYKGIYPKNDNELLQARKELADYFRLIWKDEINALEVELGVTENNYNEKMEKSIKNTFFNC